MQKTPLHFPKTVAHDLGPSTQQLACSTLASLIEEWLSDCLIKQHSPRTIELRRILTRRLLWFLEEQNHATCGRSELRAFFAYLTNGHQSAKGRWNKDDSGSAKRWTKPLRPTTIATYHRHFKAFFSWAIAEELLSESPMNRVPAPVVRVDQVQPFTTAQVQSLLAAAQKSRYPKRDEAIVLFLIDSGVRVSELCNLRMSDVDFLGGTARVHGKGNKYRTVCFGRRAARALRAYLRYEDRSPDEPLFVAERGLDTGAKLTRWGVAQVIERLGKKAGIQRARCSPHTFRHTFAGDFLRNGGNVFSLKELLGHCGLAMTNQYVALAQADIQAQHRQFSPGDRLKK